MDSIEIYLSDTVDRMLDNFMHGVGDPETKALFEWYKEGLMTYQALNSVYGANMIANMVHECRNRGFDQAETRESLRRNLEELVNLHKMLIQN